MLKKCFFSVFIFCNAWAALPSECESIAKNYALSLGTTATVESIEILNDGKQDIACLTRLKPRGYVLSPLTEELPPVKAYSFDSNFDSLPQPVQRFLKQEIGAYVSTSNKRALSSDGIHAKRWEALRNFSSSLTPRSYTPNTFLLTTQWDQDEPYNSFLPTKSGTKVLAGCVPTAISQVMRYYRYPSKGTGKAGFTWNGNNLETSLFRTLDWNSMPTKLTQSTPTEQKLEVAALLRDIGYMMHTSFDTFSNGGSNTLVSENASRGLKPLIENYGYSTAVSAMTNQNETAFYQALKTEIDANRPVLLSFPDHMAVADGYAGDISGKKIHINMGWSGNGNNFYFLNEQVQAGSYIFPVTPPNLDIYYGIKPCTVGVDCASSVDLESGDGISGTHIAGHLETSTDTDSYELYLSGQTTFTPKTIYSNLALYLSLVDGNKNPVTLSSTYSANLPMGRYYLKVSQCLETGYCYYQAKNYTVDFTTQSVTAAQKQTYESSFLASPVIKTTFGDMLGVAGSAKKVFLDIAGSDALSYGVSAASSNSSIATVAVQKNVLIVSPVKKGTATVTVQATSANGKATQKSFSLLVDDQDTAFGASFELSGLFASQNDHKEFRAYLQGGCTLQGYNGYSNQSFFVSVKKLTDDSVVAPVSHNTISQVFTPAIYKIQASLKQDPSSPYGSFYNYVAGESDAFSINVSCSSFNTSLASIGQLLGVSTTTATVVNQAPIISSIAFDTVVPLVGDTISFTATASDSDGQIVGYLWDFGDKTTSALMAPTKKYTTSGTYTVKLTVTDSTGNKTEKTQTITVAQAAVQPSASSCATQALANVTKSGSWYLLGAISDGCSVEGLKFAGATVVYPYNVNSGGYIASGAIAKGRGFWIQANASSTPTASVSSSDSNCNSSVYSNLTVSNKWDLLAVLNSGCTRSGLKAMGATAVWAFDTSVNNYSTVDALIKGYGVWIRK